MFIGSDIVARPPPIDLEVNVVASLTSAPPGAHPRIPVRRTRLFALPQARWAALASGLFLLALATQLSGAPATVWWGLYLACYAAGGWEPGLEGLKALRDKTLDVDLLMV